MQKIAALLNIKDWPLFRPIPRELNLHVRKILLHELFWNVRLALMMLLMAMALYHYLISQEIALDRFMILIVVQMTLGAIDRKSVV